MFQVSSYSHFHFRMYSGWLLKEYQRIQRKLCDLPSQIEQIQFVKNELKILKLEVSRSLWHSCFQDLETYCVLCAFLYMPMLLLREYQLSNWGRCGLFFGLEWVLLLASIQTFWNYWKLHKLAKAWDPPPRTPPPAPD